jgi:hypothetical protein
MKFLFLLIKLFALFTTGTMQVLNQKKKLRHRKMICRLRVRNKRKKKVRESATSVRSDGCLLPEG